MPRDITVCLQNWGVLVIIVVFVLELLWEWSLGPSEWSCFEDSYQHNVMLTELIKPSGFCKYMHSESFPEVLLMNTCQANSFQFIQMILSKIQVMFQGQNNICKKKKLWPFVPITQVIRNPVGVTTPPLRHFKPNSFTSFSDWPLGSSCGNTSCLWYNLRQWLSYLSRINFILGVSRKENASSCRLQTQNPAMWWKSQGNHF